MLFTCIGSFIQHTYFPIVKKKNSLIDLATGKEKSQYLLFTKRQQLIKDNTYQKKPPHIASKKSHIASKHLRALLSFSLSPDCKLTISKLAVLSF